MLSYTNYDFFVLETSSYIRVVSFRNAILVCEGGGGRRVVQLYILN